MSCLPKPELRGYYIKSGIIMVALSLGVSLSAAFSVYFFYKKPREKLHSEFMKTYDPEAHFNDLKKWGYYKYLKN